MNRRKSFKHYDLYAKAVDGVYANSFLGGIITVISVIAMVVLLMGELSSYLNIGGSKTVSHMTVSSVNAGEERVRVNFHVTFPYLNCRDLEFLADNWQQTWQQGVRLTKRRAYRAEMGSFKPKRAGVDLGCTLTGAVVVARVSGGLHIRVRHHDPKRLMFTADGRLVATGDEDAAAHGLGPDISHIIHLMGFGENSYTVPGVRRMQRSPLTGRIASHDMGTGQQQYHMKVVPTTYRKQLGYEYSVDDGRWLGELEAMGNGLRGNSKGLGVSFMYDFSPILVRYSEETPTFLQLITNVCAIIGGIFTVCSMLVGCIQGGRELSKKLD